MSRTESVNATATFRLGLLFATGAALSFGMSGPLAKSLMVAGWSPTAAVTARLAGGALVLAIVATVVKPDWLRQARAHARTVVAYGLVPVAGAQLCYYNAVAHLSVGVALLLEYTAPVLVIAWVWAIVGTLVCYALVRIFTKVRVEPQEEVIGLDQTQHGEKLGDR